MRVFLIYLLICFRYIQPQYRFIQPQNENYQFQNSCWQVFKQFTITRTAEFFPLPGIGRRLNATMSSSPLVFFSSRLAFHAYTLFLFSKSDIKTTLIPVVSKRFNFDSITDGRYYRVSSLWGLHPCRLLIKLPMSYNASCGSGFIYFSSTCQTKCATQKRINAISLGDHCHLVE